MFIDIHTHVFHPKIAEKAVHHLRAHYHLEPAGLGNSDDLLARMRGPHPDGRGIAVRLDKAVALCAATSASQVIPANNFALELLRSCPDVIPFASMHPDFMFPDINERTQRYDWEKELKRLHGAGIKGLKLHPDFQGFFLDDPRVLPLIESAQDDFIFMCHIGDALPPDKNPSCPGKLAKLLDNFPKARFIAAHFGGFKQWDFALEKLVGRKVFLDTSSALFAIEDKVLREILRRHPRELLLFGSDYPLFDPQEEFRLLQRRIKPSAAETEALLTNAAHLLGIDAA